MKLCILTWLVRPVRGLNNPQKKDFVKNLLKEWRCDVVCLQVTKIDAMDANMIRSLWGSPFVDWTVLDAVDTVGGCYYYWKKKGVGEN